MDFSSMFKSLLGSVDITGILAQEAKKYGISPTIVAEFTQGAKEILADGKITKEEVAEKLMAHANAKGVPAAVVQKILGSLGK
jgi:hypothetical protein